LKVLGDNNPSWEYNFYWNCVIIRRFISIFGPLAVV
jgi:hypothetical protein